MAGLMDKLFGPDGIGGDPGVVGEAANAVTGAGVDLAKALMDIPTSVVTAPIDVFKDAGAFVNASRPEAIASLFSREYRKRRITEAENAREWEKKSQDAEIVNFVNGLIGEADTPEALQAYGGMLQGRGYDPDIVDPLTAAHRADYDASVQASLDAGMPASGAYIANPDSGRQAVQTNFAGEITRRNQENQALLSRATNRINTDYNAQSQVKTGRKLGKMKDRQDRRAEKRDGRRFARMIPDLLEMENTEEGKAALSTNPALRGVLTLAKQVEAGEHSAQYGEEVVKSLFAAAGKGATAQGKPSDFDAPTTGTTTRRQEEMDNLMGDVREMTWLKDNFDPRYIDLWGRTKFKVQKGLNALGVRQGKKSFLQERGRFASRAEGSYLKFRKWVTGVAGEGNKTLAEELSIAIPNINEDMAPDLFLAKVDSVIAARTAAAEYIRETGKNPKDMTAEEKVGLGEAVLDAVHRSDAMLAAVDGNEAHLLPLEQMDRAAKEAEVLRRLQGSK